MASDDRPPTDPVTAPAVGLAPGDLVQPEHRAGPESAVTPNPALPATARDRAKQALLGEMAASPWRFGFFQAMRRLEALQPERPRIGASARPRHDQ